MKRIASCKTFWRTRRSTQLVLPTLPEKWVSDTQVLLLLETIDKILAEFDQPSHSNSNKSTFLENFMQQVDDWTTQYLNKCFIQ
jgi:hypothetical protein